jgi:hypothetical protein
MNLVAGTACSRESDVCSDFLGGRGGNDSVSVAGASSGFLGGSGGPVSAEAGALIWGRAGFARRVLNFLDRLLTDRYGFVTGLAMLALVSFGCDCADTHLARTALECPV